MLIFSPVALFAGTAIEPVEIESIGCHLGNSTCYVYLADICGPTVCKLRSICWDKDNTVSGKEGLSLLMAAFSSSKKVVFSISYQCSEGYPTFNYINVFKVGDLCD